MTNTAEPTRLVPGLNIGSWPESKLARALEQFRNLEARIDAWMASRPIQSHAIQVSPNEIWITLDLRTPPPLEDLALILGDALHNLRSSLDAVVWEMAQFEDANLPADRQVSFPVLTEEAAWEKWVRKAPPLSSEFLERIRLVQPFARAKHFAEQEQEQGQEQTLSALQRLNRLDKHRQSVRASVDMKHTAIEGLRLGGVDLSKLVAVRAVDPGLVHGARLCTLSSPEPVVLKDFEPGLVCAQFSIPYGAEFAPMLQFCETAYGFVRRALVDLYGTELPEATPFRRVAIKRLPEIKSADRPQLATAHHRGKRDASHQASASASLSGSAA